MLAWLEDPALRRRVTAGLNKGEARNSLARAVFFNRLGEIRDRSFENQRHRASGLNLIVAAITLWNTVYWSAQQSRWRNNGSSIPACFSTFHRLAGSTSISLAITPGIAQGSVANPGLNEGRPRRCPILRRQAG